MRSLSMDRETRGPMYFDPNQIVTEIIEISDDEDEQPQGHVPYSPSQHANQQ